VNLWLDGQLSPSLAGWLAASFAIEASHVRDHGLLHADDAEIFLRAREADVVILTKDRDFADLVRRHGPPPQVIWVTCGNTSNARMKEILTSRLSEVLELLRSGEPLVEIRDVG
jgi:predicted nuclease of predicted toxin-antitoxin system